MTTTTLYCTALTKAGKPCRSFALTGSQFCLAHDPAHAAQIAAARSAGGRARHGRKLGSTGTAERVKLRTVADVLKLLEREVNAVLTLEVSLSRGQCIARLAGAFVSAFQISELEGRLLALEQLMNRGSNGPYPPSNEVGNATPGDRSQNGTPLF